MSKRFFGMKAIALLLAAVAVLLLPGCRREAEREVRKLSVSHGKNQCALPGKPVPRVLQVRLDGPDGLPVVGSRVRFEVQKGSDLRVSPDHA